MKLSQRIHVRKGQVYKSNRTDTTIQIVGKKGEKWKAVILTDRTNVFAGSHTFSLKSLYMTFTLLND